MNKNKKKDIIEKNIIKQVYEFFTDFLPKIGFEEREGQQDMALDICEAMRDGEHIMIEAGVGIGKSYAYLLPLMLFNREIKEPVIVATSTISLQEQLMDDISAVSKMIGYYPEVVLAKGMSHFACKNRMDEYEGMSKFRENRSKVFTRDFREVVGKIGDRALLDFEIKDDIWEEINVKNCSYDKCRYYRECVFVNKRDRMANTEGIILCNHDLLIVDANKKNRKERALLSNRVEYIVIDEAHNLETKVRGILQENLNYKKCVRILNECNFFFNKCKKGFLKGDIKELKEELEIYFKILSEDVNHQMKVHDFNGTDMSKFSVSREGIARKSKKCISMLEKIVKEVVSYEGEITTEYEYFENFQDELIDDLRRIKDIIYNVQYNSVETLVWMEFSGARCTLENINLIAAPKYIDRAIDRLFFKTDIQVFQKEEVPKVIFTSATLADKKSGELQERYAYMAKNLKFPWESGEGVFSEPKDSPFDYDNNTIVYYRNKMSHPIRERDSYRKEALEEIRKLIKMVRGKTLVLFPAKEDMRWIYDNLQKDNMEYQLLMQSAHSSQEKVVTRFKEDEDSVLLGTGVFWEGVNIPGKTLSQVIIYRLPFPVPDPIIEFKRSNSSNPLMEVNVPEMIISLRQGMGRLIRNMDDTGVISILDPRIGDEMNSEYKQNVRAILPSKNISSDPLVVQKFVMEKIHNRIQEKNSEEVKDLTYSDYVSNKYLSGKGDIKIVRVKCDKAIENKYLTLREWIRENSKNINPKIAEVSGIFSGIYEILIGGIGIDQVENTEWNINVELEKVKRKLIIWKKKRIRIISENEILKLIDYIKHIRKYELERGSKHKIYREKYIDTHKVLFKSVEDEKRYGKFFHKTEVVERICGDEKYILFSCEDEISREVFKREIACVIVVYDFEKDILIKNQMK